ncbi:hypothetical protein Krac_10237 [Ktedonobacter racemifer DSM 44963]|uniref:Uncharacterized protein n=1 Tax=Ktedonobacter racemifer DSM 44963 TaxID=485913 RepID=D6TG40_KTERA|nr:hypothetical protein Krac_10237 [Ktedonobacter racemifer DSM 44963]
MMLFAMFVFGVILVLLVWRHQSILGDGSAF